MITKQTIKYIHSLGIKKYRDAEKCFVAEGPKVVSELLPLMSCRQLLATSDFLRTLDRQQLGRVEKVETVTPQELERLSLLCTPRDVLAVFEQPAAGEAAPDLALFPARQLCLFLDAVQDPGNLGTIVRLADWFGIEHVFASQGTADVFSPKVVQATMGAIGRVSVHYVDAAAFLKSLPADVPVYGTFLGGTNIYEESLGSVGLIVMGNEGNGISPLVADHVTHRLFIPPYPVGRATSESLNVAIATAIVCSEFRRKCER